MSVVVKVAGTAARDEYEGEHTINTSDGHLVIRDAEGDIAAIYAPDHWRAAAVERKTN
ncbi:hypothetical protein [Lentzea sp. CA-135723]|uniref:hypothetical protein n=1 Tax=Lentzea sp. CA-135723 TaxID=3239950 RepID=UPI003D94E2B3